MRLASFILSIALFFAPAAAYAVQPDEVLADPKLEQRARDISSELRCLVCQNQSIDDSNASLAKELRVLVREQLQAGKSDDQVRDYLVSRYGDFVLLKPPINARTLLLWILPFATLAIAGLMVLARARRRPSALSTPPLTEQERRRLQEMLEREPER
jgi:cytochrome c-type biogenesis protein CcmH